MEIVLFIGLDYEKARMQFVLSGHAGVDT
jgi:hypothetical protein